MEETQLKYERTVYDDGSWIDCFYLPGTEILHNPFGPAIVQSDGYIAHWINGQWHCLKGPSVIWPNGKVFYWIDGKQYSKEEYDSEIQRREMTANL